MDQTKPTKPTRSEQPTSSPQPRIARKPYAPPSVVSETRLETRAGSPLSNPLDSLNGKNDYGL